MKSNLKVGIIGAGQLAKMLALSGIPLGIKFSAMGKKNDCAAGVIEIVEIENNMDKVLAWAKTCTVITYENENIHMDLLKQIEKVCNVYPPIQSIENSCDRVLEKNMFKKLSIETTPFCIVDSVNCLREGAEKLGFGGILKTRKMGYDGRGQKVINNEIHIKSWSDEIKQLTLADNSICGQYIYEKFIDFDFEVSAACTRSRDGKIEIYPLTKNTHEKGILLKSEAPFRNENLEQKAKIVLEKLANNLDYVGTMVVEFFVVGDNLIANEMAPRVHNSKHWTIDACTTSQFENHVRAILGLELGGTSSSRCTMFNCIGRMGNVNEFAKFKNAKIHMYEKQPRIARKLGHITILDKGATPQEIAELENFVLSKLDH